MPKLTDVSGEAVVNQATVEELMQRQKDGESLLARLFRIYLDETPQLLAELKSCYDNAEEEACYDVIHQMKGSAAAMGATRLFLVTEEALHFSREGALFQLENVVERIEEEANAYIAEMKIVVDGV